MKRSCRCIAILWIVFMFSTAFAKFNLISPKAGDTLYVGDTIHVKYAYESEIILNSDSTKDTVTLQDLNAAVVFFSITEKPRWCALDPLFNQGFTNVVPTGSPCDCWGDEKVRLPDTALFGRIPDTVTSPSVSASASFKVQDYQLYQGKYASLQATSGYFTILKRSTSINDASIRQSRPSGALNAVASGRGIKVYLTNPVTDLRVETFDVKGRANFTVSMRGGFKAGEHEFGAASLRIGNGLYVCRVIAGNKTAVVKVMNVVNSSSGGN